MYLNKNSMLIRTECGVGVGGYLGDDYTSDQYSQPGNYNGYSFWDFPKHLWTLEDQAKANQEALMSTERPHSLTDQLLHEFTATEMNNFSVSTVNSSRATEAELVDLEAESENTCDLLTAEVRSKMWKQQCPVCHINVYGGQERLDVHKRNNHYRKCKCGMSFRYRTRLQEHINSEANVKEGKAKHGYLVPGMLKVKLVCDLCDKTFDTVEEGEKHRSSEHGIRELDSKSQSMKLRRSSKTELTEASSIAKPEMCQPPPSKKVKAAFEFVKAVPPTKPPLRKLAAFVQVAPVPSAQLVGVTFGPKGKAGPPPLLGDQVKYYQQNGSLSTGFQTNSLPKTGVLMTGSLRQALEPLTGRDVQYVPQIGQPFAGVQLFGQQVGAPLTGFTANFAKQIELPLTGFTANSAQQLIELPLTGFTSNSEEQIRLLSTGFMANSKDQTELPLAEFTANSVQQQFGLLLSGFTASPGQQFNEPPVTGFSAISGQQQQERGSITTAIPSTSRGQFQYQDVQAGQPIYQVHAPEFVQGSGLAEHWTTGDPMIYCTSPDIGDSTMTSKHHDVPVHTTDELGKAYILEEADPSNLRGCTSMLSNDIDEDEEYQVQHNLIAQLEGLQETWAWDVTSDESLFDVLFTPSQ